MKVPQIMDSIDHISDRAVEVSSAKLIPPLSLLMVIRGMILAHTFPVATNKVTVTVNQDMKALVPHVPGIVTFLRLTCAGWGARILAMVERSSHGTCKLNSRRLFGLPFPFAPLAEQKRIVAKVDELMKLCDDLEAKLGQSQDNAELLMDAVMNRICGQSSLAAQELHYGSPTGSTDS